MVESRELSRWPDRYIPLSSSWRSQESSRGSGHALSILLLPLLQGATHVPTTPSRHFQSLKTQASPNRKRVTQAFRPLGVRAPNKPPYLFYTIYIYTHTLLFIFLFVFILMSILIHICIIIYYYVTFSRFAHDHTCCIQILSTTVCHIETTTQHNDHRETTKRTSPPGAASVWGSHTPRSRHATSFALESFALGLGVSWENARFSFWQVPRHSRKRRQLSPSAIS